MKVLHLGKFYYPYMGGIENHLYNLCMGMSGKADVEVLVSNNSNETVVDTVEGIKVTRVARMAELASTPLCPSLRTHLAKARYDILHVHLPNPMGVVASLSCWGGNGRIVATYHSDIVKQKVLKRLYAPIQKKFLAGTRRIIATSPNYLAASDVLQQHKDKCIPIPYGIEPDIGSTAKPEKVKEIREKYGPRILLGCGRLVYYKGFEHAIEAMVGVDAKLLIVGVGPLESKLKQMIAERSLQRNVYLLGEVMNWDVVNYYAAADMFVLPSVTRSEAFAIVQLEAMAFGVPVVNTLLMDSGVPFVSQDGVTGISVEPRDPEALRKAIQFLLNNPDRARELGEAGKKRFASEFTREVMVNRILKVYEEALA
jgi:glycosyltransferase involved in cell wall biosynthesis